MTIVESLNLAAFCLSVAMFAANFSTLCDVAAFSGCGWMLIRASGGLIHDHVSGIIGVIGAVGPCSGFAAVAALGFPSVSIRGTGDSSNR